MMDMLMEKMLFTVDVVSLALLILAAIIVIGQASKAPLSQTIIGLLMLGLVAVGVISCAPVRVSPERHTSQDRCVDLVVQSCLRVGQCYGSAFEEECMTTTAGCHNVIGISQMEADLCAQAIERAPCDRLVPDVCLGIAEEAAPKTQQNTRDL